MRLLQIYKKVSASSFAWRGLFELRPLGKSQRCDTIPAWFFLRWAPYEKEDSAAERNSRTHIGSKTMHRGPQDANTCEGGITLMDPRWEHGVYPLYYLYRRDSRDTLTTICNRIRDDHITLFPELKDKYPTDQLTAFVDDIANTEIYLLIEDGTI